jgi:ribosome biogenesis GTPase A
MLDIYLIFLISFKTENSFSFFFVKKNTQNMGLWTEFLVSLGILKRKINFLCIGLDNSGKSTLLNKLKSEQVILYYSFY